MENINILGLGGYGCVFEFNDPKYAGFAGKINIVGSPMWSEGEVGEIRTENQFQIYQKQILSLDPKEKYFIPIREIIYMDKNYPPIKRCIEKYREKHSDRRRKPALIPDLIAVYIQTKVDLAPPVKFWNYEQLNHALFGLKLLHSIGIAHNDVHAGNYGIKNGMPVLIDMDSAWISNPLIIQKFFWGFSMRSWGSTHEDIKAFKRMLERAFQTDDDGMDDDVQKI
jgi:hypothetical protein